MLIRPLANLLYRHKDPTRRWSDDPSQLAVDLERRTVCGVPVGGIFDGLASLGRSDHAQLASRGYPQWLSKGVQCIVEEGKIGDITINLRPMRGFAAFPGRFLKDGVPVNLSLASTPDDLIRLLGEPFGRSKNDWDDAVVLFYENQAGEAQFAFGKDRGTLDTIEFWYEPELSQKGACETYGIEKEFPHSFRRTLLGPDARQQEQSQQQQ